MNTARLFVWRKARCVLVRLPLSQSRLHDLALQSIEIAIRPLMLKHCVRRMEQKRLGRTKEAIMDTPATQRTSQFGFNKEFPGAHGVPRDEEEEMRSPMIDRHQSYQNPYNIQ